MGRKNERPPKIRFTVTARRLRIDPDEKRRAYIERLEEAFKELDAIISLPGTSQKMKIRATDTLVRVIKGCYDIVRDIDVEGLERELEKIKAEAEKGEGGPGYTVQDPPL